MKRTYIIIVGLGVIIIALALLTRIFQRNTDQLQLENDQQDILQMDSVGIEEAEIEFKEEGKEQDVLEVKEETQDEAGSEQEVLGEAVQEQPKYIYFYGETCPYCHDVMDWMQETQIESILNIERREVYYNQAHQEQMNLAAQTCGESSRGVPFLFTSDKNCIIGSTPIIDYLSEKAGL
jgi:glutaredoxin